MTINVIKFSQFAAANLTNSSNMVVGVTSSSGGTNFKTPNQNEWTTSTRPSPAYPGLSGYNQSLGQIEYWNGSAWVQLASGGSGSVNVGAINQLAWYAANGTAVSGLNTANNAVLKTDASGVPSMLGSSNSTILVASSSGVISWSATLPAALNIPQPNIIGITDGSSAAAGSVGEVLSSVLAVASSISATSTVYYNVVSINLTAGDWDVWGNVFFTTSAGMVGGGTAAINNFSTTQPDASLVAQINFNGSGNSGISAPQRIFNVTTTTTVYLVSQAGFSAGTVSLCGGIYARRRR